MEYFQFTYVLNIHCTSETGVNFKWLDKKTSETPGRTETIQPGETKQHQ
jgi:hypothetical protein